MILVVCKSVFQHSDLLDALKAAGNQLVAVTSTSNALSYLWTARFEWLFCDLSIGSKHDGLELTTHCARISPQTKIVMMISGLNDLSVDVTALEHGAVAVLRTPWSRTDLDHILYLIEQTHDEREA